MRIAVFVAVVSLLLGGFWLARQPRGQHAALTSLTPVASATGTSTQADASEDEAVPEGYERTPYLSDTQEQSFEAPEEVLEPNTDYAAVIETNRGRMVVDLYEEETPQTVNNFVFLARHRYYDGVVFHRVLEGFMAQTGDPTGTGRGGPGYVFEDEIVESLGHDEPGTLSMANAGPGSNGSQFFITFAPTPHLNGRHTVFGRVVEGEEVLDKLQRIDPQRPGGAKPDVMERVYIVERSS
jgi:cyclophilin family peptidyl-prolyl cis-trans isomerase